MNDALFNLLVNKTKLSTESREEVRLVFVDGLKQTVAAEQMNISKQRINQIVNTIKKAPAEQEQTVRSAKDLVAAVDASYAFAVREVRAKFGDGTSMMSPTKTVRMVGPAAAH